MNHYKKARGFFRCQVCLIKWQSGLAWAKLSETRRIIYKYGQVCRGCGDDGHTIYVRPYDLVCSLVIIMTHNFQARPKVNNLFHSDILWWSRTIERSWKDRKSIQGTTYDAELWNVQWVGNKLQIFPTSTTMAGRQRRCSCLRQRILDCRIIRKHLNSNAEYIISYNYI